MVRFRILGPLEVWTGQGWGGIGAPKWRALLAALLLNQGQAVSTDRLIAELWGDDPPDRAANLVSVYVFRLRRVLGDPDGHVLTTRAPGDQLLLEPGDLDAERFEALAGQGRQALVAGLTRARRRAAAEALGLWRGRALADVPPTALVTAEAGRLEESRLTALELRIEADLGCGLHAQLVPELRRLLSDQPLREGLWSSHPGARRRRAHAEALAAYGQAREVIADELGVDPGPELQRLYQAMLTADRIRPPARRSAAPGLPPLAAGSRSPDRLDRRPRCTARPDAAPAAARPRPATGRCRRLHRPGRAAERLRGLLSQARQPENPAVVAVPWPAGAAAWARRALAVHAAHALRPAFPRRPALRQPARRESSSPCRRTRCWPGSYGTSGWTGARVPVDAEERAAMYRTRLAERQMLIVLDDAQGRRAGPAAAARGRRRRGDRRPPGTGCPTWPAAGSLDLDVLDEREARRAVHPHHRGRTRGRRRAGPGARRARRSAPACRWPSGSPAPG